MSTSAFKASVNPPEVLSDPEVMGGAPVFAGSRLPIGTLLACVDAGEPWRRLLESWPWLTLGHLEVARAWQRHQAGNDTKSSEVK